SNSWVLIVAILLFVIRRFPSFHSSILSIPLPFDYFAFCTILRERGRSRTNQQQSSAGCPTGFNKRIVMADKTVAAPAPAPRRQRGWLKALVWIFGVFVILLVATYFVGTSSAFFKGVILPRVSKSLNADVTVSEASISPFKEVVLHNLKVQPHNAEPLLTAPEVRARYRLLDILGGNIHLDEVALSSP